MKAATILACQSIGAVEEAVRCLSCAWVEKEREKNRLTHTFQPMV